MRVHVYTTGEMLHLQCADTEAVQMAIADEEESKGETRLKWRHKGLPGRVGEGRVTILTASFCII